MAVLARRRRVLLDQLVDKNNGEDFNAWLKTNTEEWRQWGHELVSGHNI